jgi:hypothetical protein
VHPDARRRGLHRAPGLVPARQHQHVALAGDQAGLLELPEDLTDIAAGAMVDFIPFCELGA